jgi:hypothetical protein
MTAPEVRAAGVVVRFVEVERGTVVVTKPPEFRETPLADGLGGIGLTGAGGLGGAGVPLGGLGRVPVWEKTGRRREVLPTVKNANKIAAERTGFRDMLETRRRAKLVCAKRCGCVEGIEKSKLNFL